MLWIDRNIIRMITRYETLECVLSGCRNEAKFMERRWLYLDSFRTYQCRFCSSGALKLLGLPPKSDGKHMYFFVNGNVSRGKPPNDSREAQHCYIYIICWHKLKIQLQEEGINIQPPRCHQHNPRGNHDTQQLSSLENTRQHDLSFWSFEGV